MPHKHEWYVRVSRITLESKIETYTTSKYASYEGAVLGHEEAKTLVDVLNGDIPRDYFYYVEDIFHAMC